MRGGKAKRATWLLIAADDEGICLETAARAAAEASAERGAAADEPTAFLVWDSSANEKEKGSRAAGARGKPCRWSMPVKAACSLWQSPNAR